jgi:hypothetical protein
MNRCRLSCRAGVGTTVAVLLLAGCGGGDATPAEDVPELADTLQTVESAITDHDYRRARARLDDLIDTAVDARDAGELDRQSADRLLAAAARLMTALPGETETPPATAPSSPTPEPAPEGPSAEQGDDADEDAEKKQEELEKKLEEQRKKAEEQRKEAEKEDDEDGGNGDSSDNGPHSGEGN